MAVREAVGAIEIANFSKHEITGPGARAFLDQHAGREVAKYRTYCPDANAYTEGQALRRTHSRLPC